MRYAHTVDVVRAAEAELIARLPDGALMQRASAGLAAACAQLLSRVYGARVVLLIGSGDNGGDALYAGSRLARRGALVEAVLLSPERAHSGGLIALRSAGGRVADDPAIERADLVVDGIVGIGGRGGLRPRTAALADRAGRAGIPVVAVDVPSGVDASTGRLAGAAVRARVTVTFGTYKPGLLVDPGASHAGVVELVDIGLTSYLGDAAVESLQAVDVAALLPEPGRGSDKYRRGVVGVVAGSGSYSGAALLAVGGALRGGAGMVRFVSTPQVVDLVRDHWPEAVVSTGVSADAGRVQAWVVGPGFGRDHEAEKRLDDVLATEVPVLVDADGLNLLADQGQLARAAPTLLTPHAAEAARLLGGSTSAADVEADRIAATREVAARYGATVLLKGSTTVVAPPEGSAASADNSTPAGRPVRVNPTGTPWLATAGSGDVLSGLAGALLAAGLTPVDAGSVASYLHGLAARLAVDDAGPPLTASDVVDWLPTAWRASRQSAGTERV